jgi:hypothetical protein
MRANTGLESSCRQQAKSRKSEPHRGKRTSL